MRTSVIPLAVSLLAVSCGSQKTPENSCPPHCMQRISRLESRVKDLEKTVEKQDKVLRRAGLLAADGSIPVGEPRCIEKEPGMVILTKAGVDEILAAPDRLLTDAEAKPAYDENLVLLGYRIKALDTSSVIHECGLRQGDVIHTVNGRVLTSPGDYTNVRQKLETEAEEVWSLVEEDAQIVVGFRRKSTHHQLVITGIQPLLDAL